MNSCAECQEIMSAFLDSVASTDEAARMRTHLVSCAECRAMLETYRRIGTAVRAMPAVLPPSDLTAAIYSQTIASEPRRLFLITGRMRYPMAAAAAALLIFVAAGYMLFGGYQRSIEPSIANSQPTQNEHDPWPLQRPIEITFNKSMDRASVEDALAIVPAGEGERLDKIWDGNTLLIGGNQSLRPGSEYRIKITSDARDEWGNRLDQNFELSFMTGPSIAAQTATAESVTATPSSVPSTSTATDTARATPSSSSVAVIETAPALNTTTPVIVPRPRATETSDSVDGGGDNPISTATPARSSIPTSPTIDDEQIAPTVTATPIPDPTEPAATAQATATAIAPTVPPTETPVPATATPVPPIATASPTPSPTATEAAPTPSPTPATTSVTGVFGDVYWGNQSVQEFLGEPVDQSYTTDGLQLGFQNGSMLHRADIDSIYVLVSGSSSWVRRDNVASDHFESNDGPDAGTWEPGGIFGALWDSDPDLQDTLRYAVAKYESSFIANVQTFENGTMFSAPGVVYIFYDSGTWEFWPASE